MQNLWIAGRAVSPRRGTHSKRLDILTDADTRPIEWINESLRYLRYRATNDQYHVTQTSNFD